MNRSRSPAPPHSSHSRPSGNSIPTSSAQTYSNSNNNPPPPPLSLSNNGLSNNSPSPSVLQILTIGQERNLSADSIAHHPRIESLIKLGKESEASWLQIGS